MHGFLERTIRALSNGLEQRQIAEGHRGSEGLLHSLDPRVKLVAFTCLLLAIINVQQGAVLAGMLGLALGMASASIFHLRSLALKIWLGVLLFNGVIAFPAVLMAPGSQTGALPFFHIGWSQQGFDAASRLLLRAETAATLAMLLVFTTPWSHLLKAMRVFRMPAAVLAILAMTCRYAWVLMQTACEFFEARRCRVVGKGGARQKRVFTTATTAVLLGKSLQQGEEVYAAMLARGFRGEPQHIDQFEMRMRDWVALFIAVAVSVSAWWFGGRP